MMATNDVGAPHMPVMLDEVVGLFLDAPAGVFLDATLGAGGHALGVARARRDRWGSATVIGIDRDPDALAVATTRFSAQPDVTLDTARVRFDQLADQVAARGRPEVAGVLFDLGVSSMHLDRPERGFSWRFEAPLDMRMGPDAPQTAAELLATTSTQDLARILRTWGEERHARRIADAIAAARPVTTTTQLARVVAEAMPAGAAARDRGHPARRTFQALRIAVNGELDALERALPQAIDVLVPGGVVATLAYHSLEDRIAKRTFAHAASDCTCPPDLPVCACDKVPTVEPIIRKPARASAAEITDNPRASAARLRAVRKLETP